MIYLYLLNQPESTWMKEERCEGISDTSLSSYGKQQTVKAGLSLAGRQVDGIIVGTLHRTVQAGKLLTKIFPHKLQRDKRLIDMNLGVWQGKFPEEIESRFVPEYKLWKKDPEKATIPEGESIIAATQRVQSFLQSHDQNELFDKYYLVVTHDIIIRILLTITEGKSLDKIWEYQLNPASISTIAIFPEKKVIEINNVEHLGITPLS